LGKQFRVVSEPGPVEGEVAERPASGKGDRANRPPNPRARLPR
jgi:hypothetical protein